jgi:hypothetical protein
MIEAKLAMVDQVAVSLDDLLPKNVNLSFHRLCRSGKPAQSLPAR